jgi:nucleotide-binding universal stress UspA family protein
MFKRIMVPVDLTDKNAPAIAVAAKLARQNRGRVILVHVIATVRNIPLKEMKDFYKRLEKDARQKMSALATRLGQEEITVEQEIIYGNRTEEIVKYADVNRIDLIILSSHKVNPNYPGEGWGTISYKVAILSNRPVLLVK